MLFDLLQISIRNSSDVMLNVPNQKVADFPSRHGMSDNIAPPLTLRDGQIFKQVLCYQHSILGITVKTKTSAPKRLRCIAENHLRFGRALQDSLNSTWETLWFGGSHKLIGPSCQRKSSQEEKNLGLRKKIDRKSTRLNSSHT